MNAAAILCDLFPMSDSTLNVDDREALIDKQYHSILSLLSDPCHLVRITAIKVKYLLTFIYI